MTLRRWLTAGKLIVLFLAFIIVVAPEWPAFQEEEHRLNSLIGLRQFDFVRWGFGALESKAGEGAGNGHRYLDEETRQEVVLTYLDWVARTRTLRNEITSIYADALVDDPERQSQELQAELASARVEMERLQPLAEAILQDQVATILAEEGFGLFGAVVPPVAMHMTPLPQVLIVSPREEIRQIFNVPLRPGLTVPQQEALESQIFEELNRSALVVPIGGLGFYPAMIVETGNINFLADTIAHEWAHHWLTFRPLGIRYFASPELRTINETVASVVGTEVGARVVERFYPEFAPPPAQAESATTPQEQDDEPPGEEAPAPFDFREEMAETRVEVERLLAAGEVEAAEAYMEERRQLFVSNGYPIRALNQAYFAFYGAYADSPGASGDDPVGPAVLALREQSSSLQAFMVTVAQVTSLEQLQAMVRE
ncbi:MAG: hypothetical protein ACOC9E_05175 [Chloroflexota bacterium]